MNVEQLLGRGWKLWVAWSQRSACYTATLCDGDLTAKADGATIATAIDNLRFADLYDGAKPVRPAPLAPLPTHSPVTTKATRRKTCPRR